MSTKRISRRDMLKLSGALAATSLVAACAKTTTPAPEPTKPVAVEPTKAPEATKALEATKAPEPTKPPEPTAPPPKKVEGTVTVMHFLHEFTEDMAKAFMADHPDIKVELVAADQTRFYAMYAAGTPPDIYRCQAPFIPLALARKLIYDLTPYFQASTVLKLDDLMPANNYYKAKSPLEIGDGPIYGMCKDFSPDFTVFANKKLFEGAGLPFPDDTKALTYQEVFDLARKLTKFEGDRVVNEGYGYEGGWVDRIWMNMLAELDQPLYSASYDKIIIKDNPDAIKVVQYYFDIAKEKVCASPINPSPNGWFGTDFTANILAMAQYGFWYSAMAESDQQRGSVAMLPGPTWTGKQRDCTMTATGAVVIAATKVPDAAWLVFEYYNAGQPAIDRAKSGWGVPALKSQLGLIPQESDYQKQVNRVLQAELALNTTPLQFNPFLSETSVSDSWSKNVDQALKDEITFEEMVANIETEVNASISDGIDKIMG